MRGFETEREQGITDAAITGFGRLHLDRANRTGILEIAQSESDIRQVNGVVTIHLAPDQVVAALSLKFKDESVVQQVEECNERLERQISEAHPRVTVIFTKPQTAQAWEAEQQRPHET